MNLAGYNVFVLEFCVKLTCVTHFAIPQLLTIKNSPLSRARDEMLKKGIDPDSPESKLFAFQLLKSLTTVFGRTILETGFFHAGTSLHLSSEMKFVHSFKSHTHWHGYG